MRIALSEHPDIYVDYAALAHMACLVCTKLRQPEHSAAFAQAALHSFGFTWGFGKLTHRPFGAERSRSRASASSRRRGQLRTFQKVLDPSQWQHVKPGAFSERALRMMADCCRKDWLESPYINNSLPGILRSHKSWCSALASLLRR